MAYGGYGYGGMNGPAEYAVRTQENQQEQIQNLLRTMMALKQWQWEQGQQQENRQFTQGQEERRTAADEARVKMYGESLNQRETPKPADFEKKMAYWLKAGKPPDEALARATGQYKAPEDLKTFEAKEKIKAKYAKPEKPDKTYEKELSAINQFYMREKAQAQMGLDKQITSTSQGLAKQFRQDEIGQAVQGLKTEHQSSLNALEAQKQAELNDLKFRYGKKGGAQASGSIGAGMAGITAPSAPATSQPQTPTLPPGTPTATNPKTGQKIAFINGRWLPIQ